MKPEHFETGGFAIVEGVISSERCEEILSRISKSDTLSGGTRKMLAYEWCDSLATRIRLRPTLSKIIPSSYIPVQCTYFQKSIARNWLVPYHQDVSIPVSKKVEAPGWEGWSMKEGSLFVQAPTEVLEQMIVVRIHLEDCFEQDGPLRVIPKSHLSGKSKGAVDPDSILKEVSCSVRSGGALVMRPLLLHASSRATGTSLRRLLHFVFAPPTLPFGLEWSQERSLRPDSNGRPPTSKDGILIR